MNIVTIIWCFYQPRLISTIWKYARMITDHISVSFKSSVVIFWKMWGLKVEIWQIFKMKFTYYFNIAKIWCFYQRRLVSTILKYARMIIDDISLSFKNSAATFRKEWGFGMENLLFSLWFLSAQLNTGSYLDDDTNPYRFILPVSVQGVGKMASWS